MTGLRAIDTVVVGGGQAGLVMSRLLAEADREHLVLERRDGPGGGWLDRWDAFRLVTPNWSTSFPGDPYDGSDPDGFMTRDEVVARVRGYAELTRPPVTWGTEVRKLVQADGHFLLETTGDDLRARQVIVATGGYHRPRIPAIAADLPARVTQLHSHAYRSPALLPPGGVLVVGSGQTGVQIAEELQEAGRTVHLSVGSAGRVPRRYRGRDFFGWLAAVAVDGGRHGVGLPTVDRLPDPRMRLAPNPHLSGHRGGHDTNLREFAASGMTLLGRVERVAGERIELAPDLAARLAAADRFFDDRMRPMIDTFIERAGIDAPPDDRQPFDHEPPAPATLDLGAAGIGTVIWATGYGMDHGWIDLPIFDEQGFPRHRRGVTDVPGLYFLGLIWQHTQASATLFGPRLDGPHIAEHLGLPASAPG